MSAKKNAEKKELYALLDALDAGLEYASECLVRQVVEMGVTRPLCQKFEQIITDDIRRIKDATASAYERLAILEEGEE
jgi:arginine decarboxylase-like protein